MDDLIFRDKLATVFAGFVPWAIDSSEDDAYARGLDDAYHALMEAPAVDAKPIRRGRWVRVSGYVTPGGDPVWKCSECGKGVHIYGIEASSYQKDVSDQQWVSCPNCGADMREEEKLW